MLLQLSGMQYVRERGVLIPRGAKPPPNQVPTAPWRNPVPKG
jgi:hypothetical protein